MYLDQHQTADKVNKAPAFILNESEVKYIVSTTQNQISELSQIREFSSPEEAIANHKKIMELMRVVEAFYIHKTWCA